MNTSFETKGNGNIAGKIEWLTPPEITRSLGEFDLDPCSPINRPWNTAKNHYTINDDGLSKDWFGRVWCNPPYGDEAKLWLKKCSEHKNCIALVFARTETRMFFEYVWPYAKELLFIRGRIRFYHVDGTKGGTSGAPSMLIAFNNENADILSESKLGKFVKL